jgi:hypothetical protein
MPFSTAFHGWRLATSRYTAVTLKVDILVIIVA